MNIQTSVLLKPGSKGPFQQDRSFWWEGVLLSPGDIWWVQAEGSTCLGIIPGVA